MSVQPLDSMDLNGLMEEAYKEQQEGLLGGTFSMQVSQGITLQQDTLSPGYVHVVAAAPVVPTMGPGVALGQQINATSSVAAVTARGG